MLCWAGEARIPPGEWKLRVRRRVRIGVASIKGSVTQRRLIGYGFRRRHHHPPFLAEAYSAHRMNAVSHLWRLLLSGEGAGSELITNSFSAGCRTDPLRITTLYASRGGNPILPLRGSRVQERGVLGDRGAVAIPVRQMVPGRGHLRSIPIRRSPFQ